MRTHYGVPAFSLEVLTSESRGRHSCEKEFLEPTALNGKMFHLLHGLLLQPLTPSSFHSSLSALHLILSFGAAQASEGCAGLLCCFLTTGP